MPRLFVRTPYGTSVWARFLFERYACLRPLHRVSGWLSDQGLPVSPGTLADSVPRFRPLFEPLGAAILAHQSGAGLRHADETSWRVRALPPTCAPAPALTPLSLLNRYFVTYVAFLPEAPALSQVTLIRGDSGPRRPFPAVPPALSASNGFR